jgi:hypothetical protein
VLSVHKVKNVHVSVFKDDPSFFFSQRVIFLAPLCLSFFYKFNNFNQRWNFKPPFLIICLLNYNTYIQYTLFVCSHLICFCFQLPYRNSYVHKTEGLVRLISESEYYYFCRKLTNIWIFIKYLFLFVQSLVPYITFNLIDLEIDKGERAY